MNKLKRTLLLMLCVLTSTSGLPVTPGSQVIRPNPCFNSSTGETGVCTFNWFCSNVAHGVYIGFCVDRFIIGACCKIPQKETNSRAKESDYSSRNTVTKVSQVESHSQFINTLVPETQKEGMKTLTFPSIRNNDHLTETTTEDFDDLSRYSLSNHKPYDKSLHIETSSGYQSALKRNSGQLATTTLTSNTPDINESIYRSFFFSNHKPRQPQTTKDVSVTPSYELFTDELPRNSQTFPAASHFQNTPSTQNTSPLPDDTIEKRLSVVTGSFGLKKQNFHRPHDQRKVVSVQATHNERKPVSVQTAHNQRKPVSVQATHDQRKPVSVQATHDQRRPVSVQETYDQRRPVSVQETYDQRKPVSVHETHDQRTPVVITIQNSRLPVPLDESHDQRWPVLEEDSHDKRLPVVNENSHDKRLPVVNGNYHDQSLQVDVSPLHNNDTNYFISHTTLHPSKQPSLPVTTEKTVPASEISTLSYTDTITSTKPTRISTSSHRKICGKSSNGTTGRIVGGRRSRTLKWPWMISLRRFEGNSFKHKCGATLLNQNWAITAAHCVYGKLLSNLKLRLGENIFGSSLKRPPPIERKVEKMIVHPDFNSYSYENDLALLRFDEPVGYQPNIIPICLPQLMDDITGKTAVVTGWGRLAEEGELPDTLHEVYLPILSNVECEKLFNEVGYAESIGDVFVCAGHPKGGVDACEGDSGGPMVVRGHLNEWVLVGLISWGLGCAAPKQPGVYTRISLFKTWIEDIIYS